MAADTRKVLHTTWYREHWVPYTTAKNHNLMNRSSKRASQHGSFNSPGMNRTATRCSQNCNTAQQDKKTTTATSTAASRKHHNSIIRQATSNHIKQQQPRTHGTTKVTERKASTKAKAMAATGTTTATATTKEEKASTINNRLDKEILSKDNKDMAKEKDTATKERAKDTTTTNKEEKEQKENTQQMFATDADNQDTWPNNAEWRSTTTTRHTTTTTGITRINHRCTNWRYRNHHR